MTAFGPKKIRVPVVDDHPPVRAGIRAMLERIPDISLVGEAENEHEARENYPETVTLVLSAHDRDVYLAGMLEAGAAGYLDKGIREEGLVDAIRRAARGALAQGARGQMEPPLGAGKGDPAPACTRRDQPFYLGRPAHCSQNRRKTPGEDLSKNRCDFPHRSRIVGIRAW